MKILRIIWRWIDRFVANISAFILGMENIDKKRKDDIKYC